MRPPFKNYYFLETESSHEWATLQKEKKRETVFWHIIEIRNDVVYSCRPVDV